MNLNNKTALVTGGAVRIGRAIVERLAADGCRVVIHCNQSLREAEALGEFLKKKGLTSFVVQGDLSRLDECGRVLEEAFGKTGGVDILVNNASVFHKETLETATAESFQHELDVNFRAPAALAREFARRVRAAGRRGKVVNLLDRRITSDDGDCLPYLVAKKMLAAFTRGAALEWAPEITVNGVAPGAVLPPRREQGAPGQPVDYAGIVPLRRQVTPGDVADAVAYLLASDVLTGQILYVDGGQHLPGAGEGRIP